MEMIVNTICNAPVAAQRTARESWPSVVAATMKRRWMAYTTWRIQRAAIARLWSMCDCELKHIGLTRSNITDAAKGQALLGRAASGPGRRPLESIKPQQLMSKQSTLAILAHIVRYWHKADMS
jgi:uncharacterized protein YjiS (DUF1127 family)